jgi:large subunit ribosomal protein L36e
MSSSGIAVGLNRGFPVTKRVVGARPSNNKAVSSRAILPSRKSSNSQVLHVYLLQRLSKRTKLVRELVSEVVGMSPYERRLLDMLKTGGASAEKRMYKFAKRRVSIVSFDGEFYGRYITVISYECSVGHPQKGAEEERPGEGDLRQDQSSCCCPLNSLPDDRPVVHSLLIVSNYPEARSL